MIVKIDACIWKRNILNSSFSTSTIRFNIKQLHVMLIKRIYVISMELR